MRWWFLLMLVGLPWQARAVCVTLNFANLGVTQTYAGNAGGDYNPYDTAAYAMTVNLNVSSLVSLLPCPYFVAATAGQSGSASARKLLFAGTQLDYNLYTSGGQSFVLMPQVSGGNSSNYLTGSFNPILSLLQSQAQSFVWTIPALKPVKASGTNFYTDSVTLGLYEGAPGDSAPVLRDSVVVTFRARVAGSVDLSVVNTGAAFAIGSTNRSEAFGNAGSGASRAFDISVRSNVGYAVTAQSANGQILKHATASVTSTLPYAIKVNNVSVNLSTPNTPVQVAAASGAVTPVNGTNVPVTVTLGTLSGHEVAGNYSDTVGLTVSAF